MGALVVVVTDVMLTVRPGLPAGSVAAFLGVGIAAVLLMLVARSLPDARIMEE